MYIPIQPNSLSDQIVDQIEEQILRGHLQPGDQLPTERQLGEQFGVSRTAVREAMRTLAQKGLIDVRPGRGTYVIDGMGQMITDSLHLIMRRGQEEGLVSLVEVREILEPGIAALAAGRANDEQIEAMRRAVAVMDDNLNDIQAYIAADNEFHQILAKATGNPVILALVDSVVDLLQVQRARIGHVKGGPGRGQVHHKRILAAIEERDPEAARVAMRAHLRQIRDDSSAHQAQS